ncbi:uncharacterized protein VB005_09382 [Metarhizium brunneum]
MKLSIRLVALLAGLAVGSPKLDKRQMDQANEALTKYCNEAGLKVATNVTLLIYDPDKPDNELTGSCLKKDESEFGDPSQGPSIKAGIEFCKKLERPFKGTSSSKFSKNNYWIIWCGKEGDDIDRITGLSVLNQILSDSGDDLDKLKIFVKSLMRDATGTGTDIYNALKALPTKSGVPLAGTSGPALIIFHDFIVINAQKGGSFGPETKLGKWLRTNPFTGRPGKPGPVFGGEDLNYDYDLKPTVKCIPFKDESNLFWDEDVKRCIAFHDQQPQCDTSYAYDVTTRLGKSQSQLCAIEKQRREMRPKERQQQIQKEEASCISPQVACTKNDRFWYCMEIYGGDEEVCRQNGGSPSAGRTVTDDEERQKAEALCFKPERSCRNKLQQFWHCMSTEGQEKVCEGQAYGWYTNSSHPELGEEKKQELQKEADKCFSPKLGCVNSFGQFLYCMDDGYPSLDKCRRNGWEMRRQPEHGNK